MQFAAESVTLNTEFEIETRDGEDAAAQEILETPRRPKRTGVGWAIYVYTSSTTSGRNGKGTCYETDRRTCWANARWKSGRPRWSVRREDDTTGKTAGCENGEGRTRSGRKGSGGYGPGTREREGSTSNHTTVTYTHTTPHIPITAQPQQYHAGSSRTLHTTGRGEARPTGCRSRTGAPCNKGVGDVGTGPNSRTEQNSTATGYCANALFTSDSGLSTEGQSTHDFRVTSHKRQYFKRASLRCSGHPLQPFSNHP